MLDQLYTTGAAFAHAKHMEEEAPHSVDADPIPLADNPEPVTFVFTGTL